MSGECGQTTAVQCISAGAEEFVVKPVTKRDALQMWQHVWRRMQLQAAVSGDPQVNPHACQML